MNFAATPLILTLILSASCTSVQQAGAVSDMTQEQFNSWAYDITNPVVFLVQGALEEGDVSNEQVQELVYKLRNFSEGETGDLINGLMDALQLEGYWKAFGSYAFMEVDQGLRSANLGSIVTGIEPRYREAIGILAERLQKLLP